MTRSFHRASSFHINSSMKPQLFQEIADFVNESLAKHNFRISQRKPQGSPGKNAKTMREYRLQFVDKLRDTSDEAVRALPDILKKNKSISQVTFNKLSPNSSKFPSFSFMYEDVHVDLVVSRGANKGETFEHVAVQDIARILHTGNGDAAYMDLIDQLNKANKDFQDVEVVRVSQRIGNTRKEGVAIENLGAIIGDVVMEDSTGHKWYVSLKDRNGHTFSSYSKASTLFDSSGTLQPKSEAASFLQSFGVDLNQVQDGYDKRSSALRKPKRVVVPTTKADPAKIKAIFERAWGMNYFYVKRQAVGWTVFWIDRKKLDKLTSNIRVTDIKYPGPGSKQITILCENAEKKYRVELRNSKGGEYPNDVKFQIR